MLKLLHIKTHSANKRKIVVGAQRLVNTNEK